MSRRPSSFGSACPTCFWMEECSCWNHLSIYHLESRHPAWISLKMFQVFAHSSTNTMSVGSAKDKLEVKLWVLCNSHFNDRNLDDGIRHQATVLVIGGVCGTLATKSPTTVGEERFYIKYIHTYLTSIFYYINVCHINVCTTLLAWIQLHQSTCGNKTRQEKKRIFCGSFIDGKEPTMKSKRFLFSCQEWGTSIVDPWEKPGELEDTVFAQWFELLATLASSAYSSCWLMLSNKFLSLKWKLLRTQRSSFILGRNLDFIIYDWVCCTLGWWMTISFSSLSFLWFLTPRVVLQSWF